MRYFLRLAYNGSNYHGWQRQPNSQSVQQTIEDSLSVILGKKIDITGAGRTDAGVHAKEMYAHFDYEEIIEGKRFLRSVNSLIGKDISIYDLIEVPDDAHARFDAVSRTYKYFISSGKNPFLEKLVMDSGRLYDIELMNKAAEKLLRIDDFTSFAKLHSDTKTNICRVSEAGWEIIDSSTLSPTSRFSKDLSPGFFNGIVFTITADRFLRNMVRAIVGTLLEVGAGKLSVNGFDEVIQRKDRCAAGTSVSPFGLYLWKINYPYIK